MRPRPRHRPAEVWSAGTACGRPESGGLARRMSSLGAHLPLRQDAPPGTSSVTNTEPCWTDPACVWPSGWPGPGAAPGGDVGSELCSGLHPKHLLPEPQRPLLRLLSVFSVQRPCLSSVPRALSEGSAPSLRPRGLEQSPRAGELGGGTARLAPFINRVSANFPVSSTVMGLFRRECVSLSEG